MKVSKNFTLDEFIPKEIWEMSPTAGIWLIDQRMIRIAQFIRDRFGKPVTINNYLDGGHYQYSGFRDPLCDVGAILSQHKFGRAIDAKVEDIDPAELRKDIIDNWEVYKGQGLTTIEANTPTWTHLDCRYTGQDEIFIVRGKS